MNEYRLTAIAILIILGVGFGVLISFGVAEVAYFGIAVILLTVLGSVVYTWWKTQTDNTTERLRTELLIKIRGDYLRTKELIAQAGELIDIEDISQNLEAIRRNLIRKGLYDVEFKYPIESLKDYTLTSAEQENRRIEQRLISLEAATAIKFAPELNAYIQDLNSKLNRLRKVGYDIGKEIKDFNTIAAIESKSLREMLEKKKRITDKFSSILEQCLEEGDRLLSTSQKYGIVKTIERTLLQVRQSLKDFDSAVVTLVEVRSKLKDFLKDFFAIEHEQISRSIEEISKFLDSEYIKPEQRADIEDLANRILSIKDPGLINELEELDFKFKNKVFSLIKSLSRNLQELERDIKTYAPPKDIWSADDLTAAYVKRVNPKSETKMFARYAVTALDHIIKILDRDSVILKILQNYEKVEPIISRKLREEGKLPASNLNIKYPEKFLIIYNKKHTNTEYKRNTLTLKT